MSNEKNAIDKLISYFQFYADEFKLKYHRYGINQNNPDAGMKRVELIACFLRNHLPNKCDVTLGGYIFDSLGNKSQQIDVVVINDLSIQFKESDDHFTKVFNCIEACYACISIKSYLDKDTLFESIGNLSSIPDVKKIEFQPGVDNTDVIYKQLPQKFIFAYNGLNFDTIRNYITEYCNENAFDPIDLPDMIIVNDKYHLSKVAPGGYQEQGKPFQPHGTIQTFYNKNNIGGISLFHMLTRIQKLTSISAFMTIRFDDYYREMKFIQKLVVVKDMIKW